MPDDKLKKMLENAEEAIAERDSQAQLARKTDIDERLEAGRQLRSIVLPRLLEAKEQWSGKVALQIDDSSEDVKPRTSQSSGEPAQISISARIKDSSGYEFKSSSLPYVSVINTYGKNRGNSAYQFNIEKLEDLTPNKIDEILETMIRFAYGLGEQ